MVEAGLPPKAEQRATRLFAYANSHPTLWKVGMIAGAVVASWLIKGGKAPINAGALAEWTAARDLPQADGESFRSWFKQHKEQGNK